MENLGTLRGRSQRVTENWRTSVASSTCPFQSEAIKFSVANVPMWCQRGGETGTSHQIHYMQSLPLTLSQVPGHL